jgi:hypothetical protein
VRTRTEQYARQSSKENESDWKGLFSAIAKCIDSTLAQTPSDRLQDLSCIPEFFSLE